MAIPKMAAPKATDTITYTMAIKPPVMKAITMAKMIMSGARMAVRMIIMYESCTLFVSVVRRVTSELVEKRSMFENEKR